MLAPCARWAASSEGDSVSESCSADGSLAAHLGGLASSTAQMHWHRPGGREPGAAAAIEAMRGVRHEFCVRVHGQVAARGGGVNEGLASGDVEVRATAFEVLSESAVPPFVVEDDVRASEEMRLRHRYLDLRRPRMQHVLALRHRIFQAGRKHLSDAGLLEIETPILFKSTPEGARDYLVPSRVTRHL